MIEKTLIGCFLHFFGKKDGQSMADFSSEVKAATTADRQWWINEFTKGGYKVIDA